MRKFPLLFILALLLNVAIAFAISTPITNYTEVGQENGYFQRGVGRFNQNFATNFGSAVITSAVLNNGRGVPLVADLNNDGRNEIIVIDSSTIKIFHGKSFALNSSFSIGNTADLSNMLAFDINGDSNSEIIFARTQNKDIVILGYENGSLYNKASFPFDTSITYTNGEVMLKCGAVNQCLAVIVSKLTGFPTGTTTINVKEFNSTETGANLQIGTSATHTFCFPQIKDIQYADYNIDNIKDYIFSYLELVQSGGGNSQPLIKYVDINSSNEIVVKRTITPSNLGFDGGEASPDCSSSVNSGKFITSPLVADFVTGDGLETIFGEATSSNTYKIRVFDSTSPTAIDNHPLFAVADGEILSNPIKMNAFPMDKTSVADKQNDYCIMGFIRQNLTLDLLCGSQQSFFGIFPFDTIEYFSSETYNVTRSYDNYAIMIHQINEQDNNIISNNNMDNLLNNYGTYMLTDSNCAVAGCGFCFANTIITNSQCKMSKMFSNPETNGVTISVDEEKESLEDLITMTIGNIFYIDDRYSNTAPVICPNTADCFYAPCSPIKTNTTAQVTIKATDVDSNDRVSYRLISYKGTPNEQDTGFGANVSSGTSVTFTFQANQTIGNGILELQATDTFSPTGHIVSYTGGSSLAFQVTDNGFSIGDCITNLAGTSATAQPQANATGIITRLESNNAITSGVGSVATQFGLTSEIIWIVLMIVVALATWFYSHANFQQMETSAVFGLVILVEILMFILGVLIGFISTGVLIVAVIFGVTIIAWYVRKKWTGTLS